MKPEDVRLLVLGVLQEIQKSSGRDWANLPASEKPIGALDGFDSLSAIEATVMIEEKLGCSLGLDSVFVSGDGRRALSLREISERIAKLSGMKGGKK
jgi:acyl carrier protein